jgi:hypothetical protein
MRVQVSFSGVDWVYMLKGTGRQASKSIQT